MLVGVLYLQNMKRIKIKGGLGNQLFQYAYGRKLTLVDKKYIIFDTSFFNKKSKDTDRPFLLNKFNIDPSIEFNNKKEFLVTFLFKNIISKITGNHGFYQSENYFKPIEKVIRKEFTLKEPLSPIAQDISNQILDNENSVSIHIRRGDYVLDKETNIHHGTCELDYYKKAIEYIKDKIQSPVFFIFSDDIQWSKENIKEENSFFISSPEIKDYEELIIMSNCRHQIIANSSFSWWAAWLNQNPDKIVIAPQKWLNTDMSKQPDIVPTTWIKM